ncbi:TRAP transporter substrate-binding protein [Acuticoccus mangrovi]|uniref:TRAP transporter substrate-binding protein n=1 Tax=Acuticoccus mangrovi TaxID=2796142 RepID=A0A934IPW7_9HYPH|nr:TRAP transporter substrate-binding protein [Acuticoccus mangrovi]MBJ3775434.1 TRAP transporter substrate-binding protein [Acuticoccus mangrovi]
MRRTILAAAAGAVAATLLSGAALAQDFTFTLHHFLGPKAPAHTKMLVPWAKRIEDASNGRIKIEIYPSMSLGGSPPQLFRQVADGVVDIVWTVNGYTPGLFPRSEAFELPTVFTNDIAATNLAMRAMFDDYLAPEYEAVHVLFLHVHAGQALQMASKEVNGPDDTKGLKLRVPGPTGNAVVEAMGATPVTMPVPDLPQSLSTGAVDGALIPFEIIPPLQLQETTKYQIEGPDNERFGTTTFQVSMNKAKWDGLPDDLKKVFTDNSGEAWLKEVAKIWRDADNAGIKMAVDSGNEHVVLSREEMQDFNADLLPVVEQWISEHKDFDAREIVAKAKDEIAHYKSGD